MARLAEFPDRGIRTGAGLVTLMTSMDDDNVVIVLLDGVESSALHLSDPTVLDFEYMDVMTRVLTALRSSADNVVHLGGAGCALPRAWAHLLPGSRHLVSEIDAGLANLAREWFDLPRSPVLRIRVSDGRQMVEGLPDRSQDVVVRDAFDAGVVPVHMRTRQFAAQVRRVLRHGGLYLVNLADRAPLSAARADVAALLETFAHVALVSDPAVLSGRRFGNLVLVASDVPVPAADVDRALRGFPLPMRLLAGEDVAAFAARVPASDDSDLPTARAEDQPRLDAHED